MSTTSKPIPLKVKIAALAGLVLVTAGCTPYATAYYGAAPAPDYYQPPQPDCCYVPVYPVYPGPVFIPRDHYRRDDRGFLPPPPPPPGDFRRGPAPGEFHGAPPNFGPRPQGGPPQSGFGGGFHHNNHG